MTDRRRTFSDRRSMPDPEPPLRAWLSQPVELPESDLARIAWLVHNTPQQRRWSLPHLRSSAPMFTALKLTAAGAILASVGLFLFNAAPTKRVDVPAVSPSPTAAAILAPSASPIASLVPTAQPIASPVVSPEPAISPAASGTPVPSASPVALGPVAFQYEPGDGTRVGPWVKLGSRRTFQDGISWSEVEDLQSLGSLLVGRVTQGFPDETTAHHIVVSTDGLTWSQAEVPASEPWFNHLFAGPDGLVLAGYDLVDGKKVARLWTSPDGLAWTEAPAPPTKTIDQVVAFGDLRVVVVGNFIWLARGDGDWEKGTQMNGFRVLAGPDGFQFWGDGGSGSTFFMTHMDPEWTEIREVGAPRRIDPTDANLGVVGDQWVLVPSSKRYPDTIFVSADGMEWTEVPRPAALTGQEMRWITEVDGQAMAYGPSLDDEGVGAIWTWTLGEAAPEHALFPRSDEYLLEPAVVNGTVYASGKWSGEASEATIWVYQPEG